MEKFLSDRLALIERLIDNSKKAMDFFERHGDTQALALETKLFIFLAEYKKIIERVARSENSNS